MSRRPSRRSAPRPVVVLDFGGVLSAGHDPLDVIVAITGGDPETVARAYWDERVAYDGGRTTPAEYWGAVAAAGAIPEASDVVIEDLQDADDRYWLRLDPESRGLVHDLARNGVTLVLLSNASVAFGEAVRKADWFEAFFFAVISGEERIAKPDPEIFEILLSALAHESGGVQRPGSVIFFDDREDNVETARRRGIDAHVWPRNDPARGEGVANPGVAMAREVLTARGVPLD
ncbi:HAD-IA family hydrolase [Brachybacterium huguangmaarense]